MALEYANFVRDESMIELAQLLRGQGTAGLGSHEAVHFPYPGLAGHRADVVLVVYGNLGKKVIEV